MLYAIALGSNQRHVRFGSPDALIEEAIGRLPGDLVARSRTVRSRPLGPSIRTYANAAAVIDFPGQPPSLLEQLQQIERNLGRTRKGQRWRARTMDLDILLWEGGLWADPRLSIPHPQLPKRDFVLQPLAQIAAQWCDPLTNRRVIHLLAVLKRSRLDLR